MATLHDLLNPIHQILGYSELLMEQEEQSQDDLRRDLERIHAAAERLMTLIRLDKAAHGSRLTAQSGSVPALSCEPGAVSGSAATMGSILVVDDDPANRDLLARHIERQGHTVASAESGAIALEMLRQRSFDLVLLDVVMPEMDGLEVLERIKADEQLRHVPVIIISVLTDLDAIVRGIQLGAEDYLPRSFNPVLLKARIDAELSKKRLRDQEAEFCAQLEENYRRLQELEKRRKDLTRLIVHDMRTPLASSITSLQTLQLMTDLEGRPKELLSIALRSTQQLLGMINDMLDLSKMEDGVLTLDRETVQAESVVRRAVEQVAPLALQKNLTLTTQVAPDLPDLQADVEKLTRVLVNLLGNAITFTPSGGNIEATVERTADVPSSMAGALSGTERAGGEVGGELLFAVRDDGEGIPESEFARIFEPFAQVETRRAGHRNSTGLGLAFCKMAVEAHGGRIWVESQLGAGSSFFFVLPHSRQ